MPKPTVSALLSSAACWALFGGLFAAHAAANNPHSIDSQGSGDCRGCHVSTPAWTGTQPLDSRDAAFIADRYKLNAIAMCVSCHPRDHLHAEVGDKIDFAVPPDMPLGENNGHVCLTCHYTHGRLDSEQPRANVDFLDRWFDTARMRKSYLLRRDNSDGGLCLSCHNQGISP
ncbi:hypothetical protein [Methylomonas rivi]|uniref:Doubled CXXCH motif domain-containing protein n=1 Tax=Methylomonas rivi TaxID=2952226 RepID=A0ABT1UAI7_9GAMM|nr:hypothetical protein [Methylomonas sp. WSC-6]MCQ8130876.1 hypothetical protein [Methylomonas sp. WSC-6]